MNDAPFLINGVLRFTGEVPDDARTQSERPGKLQRFVRLSDERISMNDWNPWTEKVEIYAFPFKPEMYSYTILRGVDVLRQPYTIITVHGQGSHELSMQVWDHRPQRLHTVLRGLDGKNGLKLPFQIMTMTADSTLRLHKFARELALHTGRTDTHATLTQFWESTNVHA